ncbi:MAG: acetyl-CoA carboxylase biotin carboxyl carrier protein subunit [candidate division WOR-3 bacterium]|nr:acetyl-CoA carboxylase biotin carboxyl carrier protein subunit [candidate division WOR-3 bacterium]
MGKKEEININYDRYKTNVPDDKQNKQYTPQREKRKVLRAVIPGTVLDIEVSPGDSVKEGDCLLILEAMKMRNRIYAERDGVIKSINVKPGERVPKDHILLTYR